MSAFQYYNSRTKRYHVWKDGRLVRVVLEPLAGVPVKEKAGRVKNSVTETEEKKDGKESFMLPWE